MMISFDFLSEPIDMDIDKINVLCIENKHIYRKIFMSFYNGTFEDDGICISKNFTPIKFKNDTEIIYDYFSFSLSTSSLKKIYDDMSYFCETEMSVETNELERIVINFMEKLCQSYDYDFVFNDELNLTNFFKSQDLKINFNSEEFVENLLDYVLLLQKYLNKKLFILFNLHLFFSNEELDKIYMDIISRNINVLVIENNKNFQNNRNEKYTIFDKDLCEIVDD